MSENDDFDVWKSLRPMYEESLRQQLDSAALFRSEPRPPLSRRLRFALWRIRIRHRAGVRIGSLIAGQSLDPGDHW